MGGSCSAHGKYKYASGVWRENLNERDYLEDMLTWEDNIKMGLNQVMGLCDRLIPFMIETSCELL
jgi:hypothetical protein